MAEDPAYVAARAVLLDALDALQEQLDSLVLVGAQAVYLRMGSPIAAVAPYTTDADLAVDPRALRPSPPLPQDLLSARGRPGVVMAARALAGFVPEQRIAAVFRAGISLLDDADASG